MDAITNRQFKNIIMTFNDNKSFKEFKAAQQDLNSQIKSGTTKPISVPGILDYFTSFISLISLLANDRNNATESKAQSYFSLE